MLIKSKATQQVREVTQEAWQKYQEIGIAHKYVVVRRSASDDFGATVMGSKPIPLDIIDFMDALSSPNYDNMTYRDIVKLARERGMKPQTKPRSEVIEWLKKWDITNNDK